MHSSGIRKELDSVRIELKRQRFEKSYKRVQKLFIVKVEFEANQLVQEGVRQNVN